MSPAGTAAGWSGLARSALAGLGAGALVGCATLPGDPVAGAVSVVSVWMLTGAVVGLAVDRVVAAAQAAARWYGVADAVVLSLAGVALLVWPVVELGGRPWAARVPGGRLVSWCVVAAMAASGAQVMAWLLARPRGRWVSISLLGIVAILVAVLPQGWLLPLPAVRWALILMALVAAVAGFRGVLGVPRPAALLCFVLPGMGLFLAGATVPVQDEHLLTSTLRTPLIAEETGPPVAELNRARAGFGRRRSGRQDELAARLPTRRLNVLWLTICTFRHDRLGRGDLTPSLDALSERSRVFDRAWTTFPASAPASESMFSGRYALACDSWRRRLGLPPVPGQSWLPFQLKEAGYATWAFTSLGLVASSADFRPLFEGFDLADPAGVMDHRLGVDTVAALTRQLELREAGAPPFLAWLFLMDAHAPYEGDPERPDPDGDDLSRYDGEIRAADRAVGHALEALRRLGLADSTMIIVHADHGEAFGEHGASWHGSSVYEEQARVPLVIHVPGLEPGRCEAPVDLSDLAPTVLEVLDVPGASGLGDSLVPALLGRPFESHACSELLVRTTPAAGQRMIVGSDMMKLIQHGNGTRELYDLSADPGELARLPMNARGEELAALLAARVHLSVSGARQQDEVAMPAPLPGSLPDHVRKAMDLIAGDKPGLAALQLVHQWVPRRALEAARKLVVHPWQGARVIGLNHLATYGEPSDVPLVEAALRDRSLPVRIAAADTYCSLVDPATAEAMAKQPVPSVRDAVERALAASRVVGAAPLRALAPRAPTMPLPALERLLSGLADCGDADTVALAEAVARAPEAPVIERWRALGMLVTSGSEVAGPVGRQLLRGGLPPEELLEVAINVAPDDPRPMAALLLEIIERGSSKLGWKAYKKLLDGWSATEATALVHAWQDHLAGMADGTAHLREAGVDFGEDASGEPVFDDVPPLITDVPWVSLRARWPAVPLRVRFAEPTGAPVRLRLRAGWTLPGGQELKGPTVDATLRPSGAVVVPLPRVLPGTASGQAPGHWLELVSVDGRTRRLP